MPGIVGQELFARGGRRGAGQRDRERERVSLANESKENLEYFSANNPIRKIETFIG